MQPLCLSAHARACVYSSSCAFLRSHGRARSPQGGLLLLVPLAESSDVEVQRLAAHAIANLAVNGASAIHAAASVELRVSCPISLCSRTGKTLAAHHAHQLSLQPVCSGRSGKSHGNCGRGWDSASGPSHQVPKCGGTEAIHQGARQSRCQRRVLRQPPCHQCHVVCAAASCPPRDRYVGAAELPDAHARASRSRRS